MNVLHSSNGQIDAYLDGELPLAEQARLLAHCQICETCGKALEGRRALLEMIRSARPRVTASPGLRAKVASLLETERSAVAGRQPATVFRGLCDVFLLVAGDARRGLAGAIWPLRGYALALLALFGAGACWVISQGQVRAASFVQMAAETHQRQLQGALPIEFQSGSAREITVWFDSRLPFSFRLPTYQDESSDRSKYSIIGCSLTSFNGKSAAYVAYRMRNELISLVVVSSDQARASGGETTTDKSLVFHSLQQGDFQIVTWSVHHLTYALVSNVKLPQRQSCVVCHANPNDHQLRGAQIHHPTTTGRPS